MSAFRIVLTTTAVIGAVLACGCGGGGSGNGGEAGASSTNAVASGDTRDFVERANDECERERAPAIRRAYNYLRGRRGGAMPASEVYAEMIKLVLLPTIEREIEAIQALGVPAKQKAHVDPFFAADKAAIKEVAGLRGIPSMAAVEAHFVHASALARVADLPSCANSMKGTG